MRESNIINWIECWHGTQRGKLTGCINPYINDKHTTCPSKQISNLYFRTSNKHSRLFFQRMRKLSLWECSSKSEKHLVSSNHLLESNEIHHGVMLLINMSGFCLLPEPFGWFAYTSTRQVSHLRMHRVDVVHGMFFITIFDVVLFHNERRKVTSGKQNTFKDFNP